VVDEAQRQRTRFKNRRREDAQGASKRARDFFRGRPAMDERFGGNMEASNNARSRGIMNEDLLDQVMDNRRMRREAEQYRNQMLREDYAIANSNFGDFINPDIMARQFSTERDEEGEIISNLQAGKLAEIYNQLNQGANSSDIEFEDGQAMRDLMGFTNDLQLNPGNYDSMYMDEEIVDDGPGVIFDTDGYFTKDEAVANSPYGAFNQGQMERYGRENPRIINRTETAVANDGSLVPQSNAVSIRDYEGNQASMNGEIINRADALPVNYNRRRPMGGEEFFESETINPNMDLYEKFYDNPFEGFEPRGMPEMTPAESGEDLMAGTFGLPFNLFQDPGADGGFIDYFGRKIQGDEIDEENYEPYQEPTLEEKRRRFMQNYG